MILLLVMTDGRRDCIEPTLLSARKHLDGPITRVVIHDDSADPGYREWLVEEFPHFEVFSTEKRSGFGGAIRSAWAYLNRTADLDLCRFVFHLEDDFLFNRDVDLNDLAATLDRHPEIVQMALRRQPWNDTEVLCGGVIETNPRAYTDCFDANYAWLEHRQFFTTNPSLYRRSLTWSGWPEGDHSEGVFGIRLLEDPALRFGYWGRRDSGEAVHHIGTTRVGGNY